MPVAMRAQHSLLACARGLIWAVLAGFAWTAGSVSANTASPHPAPPPEIAAALPAAILQGRGLLRFFGLAVYEARLWAAAGFESERYPAQPFALELRYARALAGPAIAERSIAEMRRSGDIDEEQARRWQQAMTRAFPDVVAGDRLTGLSQPDGSTRFFLNGQPTSSLVDAAFTRRFFGIWLAPTTSEPSLRRQLIGQVQ